MKNILQIHSMKILTGFFILLLIGCGSTKLDLQGSTDYASRLETPQIINTDTQTVSNNIAICNQIPLKLMKMNLQIYRDPLNPNSVNLNVMKVLIQMTASQGTEFENTAHSVDFLRVLVDDNNKVAVDKTKLMFRFENRSTHLFVTGYFSDFNWAAIRKELTNNGIKSMPSAADFFKNHILILSLVHDDGANDGKEYDALQVAHYISGTLSEHNEGLLPAFYADPNKYKLDKPARLQALHPFYAEMGKSTSTSPEQYASDLNGYCF